MTKSFLQGSHAIRLHSEESSNQFSKIIRKHRGGRFGARSACEHLIPTLPKHDSSSDYICHPANMKTRLQYKVRQVCVNQQAFKAFFTARVPQRRSKIMDSSLFAYQTLHWSQRQARVRLFAFCALSEPNSS